MDNLMKATAIDKAFHILDFLIEHPEGLLPADLGRQIGYPRGTLYRLLNTLVANGFAHKETTTGKYVLGPKFLRAFSALSGELRLYDKALPQLKKLVQETGEAVYLARLQAGQVVILESIQPADAGPGLYWSPGKLAPLHCTAMGKILLADLPRADLEQQLQPLTLTAFTPKTITSVSELADHLAMVSRRGFAVDDEELMLGWRCVGVPIRDFRGQVIAALSVSSPTQHVPPERVPSVVALATTCAQVISAELGYEPAAAHVLEQPAHGNDRKSK